MRINSKLCALAVVSCALSTPALAAEDPLGTDAIPGAFSANVGFVSEYYFRGLSQTDDTPAVQGGFDYALDLHAPSELTAYAGVWGSNLDFNDGADGASIEVDLYGGLKGKLLDTGIGWDAGFIYYWYPGVSIDPSPNYDFIEGKLALSYDFGFAALTASYNYSPDFCGGSGHAHYPKLQLDVPVGKYLTLSGYVAHQWVEKNDAFLFDDYLEWNLKAATKLAGFDLFIAYTDTDLTGVEAGEGMVVFGVSRTF
jgi:uncharacterized protein (TIGR02001 family)